MPYLISIYQYHTGKLHLFLIHKYPYLPQKLKCIDTTFLYKQSHHNLFEFLQYMPLYLHNPKHEIFFYIFQLNYSFLA